MPLTTLDPATLEEDGCKLVQPVRMFLALLQATNNDPCGTGCFYRKESECDCYQKHHSVPINERRVREQVKHAARPAEG